MGSTACNTCSGTGYVTKDGLQHQCEDCGGTGRIEHS